MGNNWGPPPKANVAPQFCISNMGVRVQSIQWLQKVLLLNIFLHFAILWKGRCLGLFISIEVVIYF